MKDALLPYGHRTIKFAGFVVIDSGTRHDDETKVLATRKHSTQFDVDLVCIESLKKTVDDTYEKLKLQKR